MHGWRIVPITRKLKYAALAYQSWWRSKETDIGVWKHGNLYFAETKYLAKPLRAMICEVACVFNELVASGKELENKLFKMDILCKWLHLARY